MASISIGIRTVLLCASATSFAPQYRSIMWRGDCAGLSLSYVLLNLIAATAQLAFMLHAAVVTEEAMNAVAATPLAVADWQNLLHCGFVWLGNLVLFILSARLVPPKRAARPGKMVAIYVAVALALFGPIVVESALPPSGSAFTLRVSKHWVASPLTAVFIVFVNPASTVVSAASFYLQARELTTKSQPPYSSASRWGALSTSTLALQAVVFFLVGIHWPFRFGSLLDQLPANSWYELVGWGMVDNLVFAMVQGLLYLMATRRRLWTPVEKGERSPLLYYN